MQAGISYVNGVCALACTRSDVWAEGAGQTGGRGWRRPRGLSVVAPILSQVWRNGVGRGVRFQTASCEATLQLLDGILGCRCAVRTRDDP